MARGAGRQAMITFDEIEVLLRAVRPLDCGHHHCRYCSTGSSDGWKHTENCPYEQSVRDAEEAKKIIERLKVENAEV